MVCKMLIGISYTVESIENQLFIVVLCKMYEMCVIKRCSVILLLYNKVQISSLLLSQLVCHSGKGNWPVKRKHSNELKHQVLRDDASRGN